MKNFFLSLFFLQLLDCRNVSNYDYNWDGCTFEGECGVFFFGTAGTDCPVTQRRIPSARDFKLRLL